MKNILISSYDMDLGGVERSLINMLENFNYQSYNVDLMLHIHTGELLNYIPKQVNLLDEIYKYTTLRKSIKDNIKEKQILIAMARISAKLNSIYVSKRDNIKDISYYQLQLMYKYSNKFLPKQEKEYDVAISYLWPHYYIADKVKAKTKIAWIHTDYSIIDTDIDLDLKMWNKFDYIISISEDVTKSFLAKYPSLKNKIVLVENITSPKFIRDMSNEKQEEITINDKYFNIVSVGRFSHAKGFDNAIKALKKLHEKGLTNIKWYVVGYGEDEDLLKSLIKENSLEDSFILLGKKTNPYPYIKVADLYVQPSRYEGKAVTVSEAQILGKPVMITNYSTANSQVKNRIDGYICALSVEGIAEGIEKLYKDKELRQVLVNNCKNTDYANSHELEKLYEII